MMRKDEVRHTLMRCGVSLCPMYGKRHYSGDPGCVGPVVEIGTAGNYRSQSARDAERGRTTPQSYADYLEESAHQTWAYYMARGDAAKADEMLTRSLSQALMGNDGD